MIQYVDLIGVPFEYGGRSLGSLDCYGLVMECNRRNGIDIPDQRSPQNRDEIAELMGSVKSRWNPLWTKEHVGHFPTSEQVVVGSTLLLQVSGLACHVGYVLDHNKFIHAWEAIGGIATERLSLWNKRILGIYKFDDTI
jgi:cell wall-associated NlpC family hydrolase